MKQVRLLFLLGCLMILFAVVIGGFWQPTTFAQSEDEMDLGAAALAVDLLDAWVSAGAPEMDPFDYTGQDGNTYQGTFEADVLPLFTTSGVWDPGAPACISCHFANSEESFHEMNLGSYEGIRLGGDVLSEPPGVSLLGESTVMAGDFDWDSAKLRHRLRDNRMPPGSLFDITEGNRDGPTLTVNGVEVRAVDLIGDWVNAGAPETEAFGDYGATFAENIQPLFTTDGVWYKDSPACTTCHFDNTEDSYHEMNLGSYEGLRLGADVNEDPPGVSILGESEPFAGDFDWEHSELRHRLRDNRMPPGAQFVIDESNRNGSLVLAGTVK